MANQYQSPLLMQDPISAILSLIGGNNATPQNAGMAAGQAMAPASGQAVSDVAKAASNNQGGGAIGLLGSLLASQTPQQQSQQPSQGQQPLDQQHLDALAKIRQKTLNKAAEEAYNHLGDSGSKQILDNHGYYNDENSQTPSQQPQQQGGINPLQIIGKLLGATQGGYNPQTGNQQVPGLLGGLLTSTPQMLEAMNQTREGNPNYQVGLKSRLAQEVPLNVEQQATFASGIYSTKIKAAQDSLTDFHNQLADLNAQSDAAAKEAQAAYAASGTIGKFTGSKEIRDTLQNKVATINKKRTEIASRANQASSRLASLLGNAPEAPTPSSGSKGNSFSGQTSTGVKFRVSA